MLLNLDTSAFVNMYCRCMYYYIIAYNFQTSAHCWNFHFNTACAYLNDLPNSD